MHVLPRRDVLKHYRGELCNGLHQFGSVHRRDVSKYGVYHNNFHPPEIVRWIRNRHLQCNTVLDIR